MSNKIVYFAFLYFISCQPYVEEKPIYFPTQGEWTSIDPIEVGFEKAKLDTAIEFAKNNQSKYPYDLGEWLKSRYTGPNDSILGPTKERGDMSGMIIKDGYLVHKFGDIERVDMTFSVTKSFLSTTAALAFDAGLITDFENSVYIDIEDSLFKGERNETIKWSHLLNQSSEWVGTLWEKPDIADRRKGKDREIQLPGTFFEYNDVRVNLTAYALLRVWERPLPEVLKSKIMDPIGASNTWIWNGYSNSYIEIKGKRMQSVSGGGHWGGGMWINTQDLARFGYLFLNYGHWNGKQLFDSTWINLITTPSASEPRYSHMWWLNTNNKMWEDVPENSYAALGAGTNFIWIYPSEQLVVVIRWIDSGKINEFLSLLLSSLKNTE